MRDRERGGSRERDRDRFPYSPPKNYWSQLGSPPPPPAPFLPPNTFSLLPLHTPHSLNTPHPLSTLCQYVLSIHQIKPSLNPFPQSPSHPPLSPSTLTPSPLNPPSQPTLYLIISPLGPSRLDDTRRSYRDDLLAGGSIGTMCYPGRRSYLSGGSLDEHGLGSRGGSSFFRGAYGSRGIVPLYSWVFFMYSHLSIHLTTLLLIASTLYDPPPPPTHTHSYSPLHTYTLSTHPLRYILFLSSNNYTHAHHSFYDFHSQIFSLRRLLLRVKETLGGYGKVEGASGGPLEGLHWIAWIEHIRSDDQYWDSVSVGFRLVMTFHPPIPTTATIHLKHLFLDIPFSSLPFTNCLFLPTHF